MDRGYSVSIHWNLWFGALSADPQLLTQCICYAGEREVGTEAKMLLLAQEDKTLQCLGLQSRQQASGSYKKSEFKGYLGH